MQAKKANRVKRLLFLFIRILYSFVNLKVFICAFPRFFAFVYELFKYHALSNNCEFSLLDIHPRIHDKKGSAGIGGEAFYQDTWAFRVINENLPKKHIDVGSSTLFVGMLSVITKVIFIELRSFNITLPNLDFKQGDILHLPFDDSSVLSLSCLHTIEHIGLGRYGDRLDPEGAKKAIKELQRVLAPQGNLYVTVPIGRSRTEFNCHRVFSPQYIINEFNALELVELSGVGPDNLFYRNIDIQLLENLEYGIALFHFKRTLK